MRLTGIAPLYYWLIDCAAAYACKLPYHLFLNCLSAVLDHLEISARLAAVAAVVGGSINHLLKMLISFFANGIEHVSKEKKDLCRFSIKGNFSGYSEFG